MNRKYVIISDMHRGIGDYADECFKNIDLVEQAYDYYLNEGFTLIENGDCEELCENRSPRQIWETYRSVYEILQELNRQGRLVVIRGNRDAYRNNFVKLEDWSYDKETMCFQYKQMVDSFDIAIGKRKIRIEHGHRMSPLFYFPKLEQWLVRHFWMSTNRYGITQEMCSPWHYKTKMSRLEEKLNTHFKQLGYTDLIIGHTHQSKMCPEDGFYNSGSSVRPSLLQCIEICEAGNFLSIMLIEWKRIRDDDGRIRQERSIVACNTSTTGTPPSPEKTSRSTSSKRLPKVIKLDYNKSIYQE